MAWIKLFTSFLRNPKTHRLARTLNLPDGGDVPPVVQAAGLLVSLWTTILDVKEDGDLSGYTAQGIADFAGWKGDPAKFANALVTSNLLDVTGKGKARTCFVHDWKDYAEPYLRRKYAQRDPDKWKVIQATLDQRKSFAPPASEENSFREATQQHTGKADSSPNQVKRVPENELERLPLKHKGLTSEKTYREEEIREEKEKKKRAHRSDVKVLHAECVFLSNDELAKLRVLYSRNFRSQMDNHGDERLRYGIQKLNDYIMARAKTRTYKSHYHVLRGWVIQAVYEDEEKGRLKFAPPKMPGRGGLRSFDICRECGQQVDIAVWHDHICNRNTEEINREAVEDAVKRLSSQFRMPGKSREDRS